MKNDFSTAPSGDGFPDGSIWISAADSAVRPDGLDPLKDKAEAEDGTACFLKTFRNPKPVVAAEWTVAGLGVFRVFANGREAGADDVLKPGFTHYAKTKYFFRYDVTPLLAAEEGAANELCAFVSAGWWRDKIVLFRGKRSAFRAVLRLRHADGTETRIGTDATWLARGAAGPVTHAAIFDGEDFDARLPFPAPGRPFPADGFAPAAENREFSGELLPMPAGAGVLLRRDLAMEPREARVWRGVEGADSARFGRTVEVRTGFETLSPGETLVVDFGQNCAAVPEFEFSAPRGAVFTARPAEMLNDGFGEKSRNCDGPGGSAHFAEYRNIRTRARYVFAGGGVETWRPTFTFYGGRYLSATVEGGEARIRAVRWIPVTSIAADSETGSLETGVPDLDKFVSNVLWSQRSNYLSIPSDCPQRGERLGWTADTQIFAKAASYNADSCGFLRKWMRDMRDSQQPDGAFPGVAPAGMIGDAVHQFGWGDAGVIVPYTAWRHFGDPAIVRENWAAMERYLALVEETKFESPQAMAHQWADWLSLEKLETCSGRAYVGGVKNVPPVKEDALELWRYFGACYWLWDARMMAEMASVAGGGEGDVRRYREMAARALAYVRKRFVDPADGLLEPLFRDMQTPALFALKLGVLEPGPAAAARDALFASIREHGTRLKTGFLGTAMLLDVLTDLGATDLAYSLLLQHEWPSWLYPVDQGATTIWESWDAWTREKGFAPGDRSLNHYAYGAIVAWMYGTMAGIRENPGPEGGFRRFVLAPHPDPRVGRCTARYRSPCGVIESSWRCESDGSVAFDFAVPAGTTASLVLPGLPPRDLPPGRHEFRLPAP
ncbi:MAG: family 78 glycoside hydrolase catalytic domain, partial [Kiritimatiellae bacterium]|nr:family 78 glycoside hydrolase catalytic domain [Kiritimatiellia bacterium]